VRPKCQGNSDYTRPLVVFRDCTAGKNTLQVQYPKVQIIRADWATLSSVNTTADSLFIVSLDALHNNIINSCYSFALLPVVSSNKRW
jgi:hypothetical protein